MISGSAETVCREKVGCSENDGLTGQLTEMYTMSRHQYWLVTGHFDFRGY